MIDLFFAPIAFLNPISSGSGVSLKTLRVLAGGLPLISTPFGVRGLEVEPGVDALVSDLSEFERVIDELLADSELQTSLSVAGHNYASHNHNWAEISLRFASTILGDDGKFTTFNYIPVRDFSDYDSLTWLNELSFEFIKVQKDLPTLPSSLWFGRVKPLLRKYVPKNIKRIVRFISRRLG